MIGTLYTQGLKTPAQVQAFVSNNEAILFTLTDRVAAYGWMTDTLKQFHYSRCARADKGVLRQYPRKVTGLSRAQAARCIKQFSDDVIQGDSISGGLCRGAYQRSLSAAGSGGHDGCLSV